MINVITHLVKSPKQRGHVWEDGYHVWAMRPMEGDLIPGQSGGNHPIFASPKEAIAAAQAISHVADYMCEVVRYAVGPDGWKTSHPIARTYQRAN